MRSNRGLLVALGAGLILVACVARPAASEEPPPGRFGCYHDVFAEDQKPDYESGLVFERTTPEEIAAQHPLPTMASRFGPFALADGSAWVVKFFVETLPATDAPCLDPDDGPSRIRLVASVEAANTEMWYRLEGPKDWLQSEIGEPQWTAPTYPARSESPVFVFSWSDSSRGMHDSCDWTTTMVLDFRGSSPVVPVAVHCGECEVGGACTASDAAYSDTTGFDCAWDQRQSDFFCTEATTARQPWTERTFARYFWLLSKTDVGFHEVKPDGPVTLAEFVAWLHAGRASVGTPVTIPGIGPVAAIVNVPNLSDGKARYILASAPERGDTLRFFFTRPSAAGPPTAMQIPLKILNHNIQLVTVDSDKEPEAFTYGTRLGPIPSYHLSEVARGVNRVRMLQVVAQEGNGRSVYLIGVDDRTDQTVVQSLAVASDRAWYRHCGVFDYGPQIAPSGLERYPLDAVVEVEPSHSGHGLLPRNGNIEQATFYAESNDEPGSRTSAQMRLRWTHRDGFVLEPTGEPSGQPSMPRFVVIDEGGKVTLHRPAAVEPAR